MASLSHASTAQLAVEDDVAYIRQLLATAETRIRNLEARLAQTQAKFDAVNEKLNEVITSSGWRWVMRGKRLRNLVFPEGTKANRFVIWLTRKLSVKPRLRAPARFASDYDRWIALYEPAAFAKYPAEPAASNAAPTISLLVTSDDADALRITIASVLAQTDSNWDLCVIANRTISEVSHDQRVRIIHPDSALQAERLNTGLRAATGGFICVIEAGDKLASRAVASLRHTLAKEPEIGLLYSDEDALDERGRRCNPAFKSDWSPESFRSQPYLGHLTLFRSDLVKQVGGFRSDCDGAAVYDLALRVSEHTTRIRHLPVVLYHTHAKTNQARQEAAIRAVQAQLDRQGVVGDVVPGIAEGTQQVRYAIQGKPFVSIIIPSKDQPELLERCVESILASDYAHREVVLLDNASQTPRAHESYARLAQKPGVRVLPWNHPFNYAAINNYGVKQTTGEVLLFLNNDMQVISRDWLERMLEHAMRPQIGAVGAKLLYADGTVQHAGVIIGMNDRTSGHYCKGEPGDAPGYMNRLVTVQELSSLTGACLMMRRAVFDEVGGFDEQFAVNFNDIDLCLRIRAKAYRILWTPHAQLFHFECQTRGHQRTPAKQALYNMERELFLNRWGKYVEAGDPFYSPHLSLKREDCAIRE